MTIDDLIKSAQARLRTCRSQRSDQLNTVRSTLDNAKGRALTQPESATVDAARKSVESLNDEIADLDRKLDDYREMAREELDVERLSNQRTPTGVGNPAYDQVARIGQEARTYRPDNSATGQHFFRDVLLNWSHRDIGASDRLARHMQEEMVERGQYMQRAVGTGAFAGLTVPQYLTDMVARRAQAWKPLAVNMNTHTLPPDGMTVNISRITTGTSTAVQSAENAAVSETNIDDTLLTEDVLTIAGQQTLSRQAIERGTLTEETVVDDLMRSLATTLDTQLITRATIGLTNVAQSFSYTDASPTSAELWPKILQGVNGIETTLLNVAAATHVVMHPRRWHWFTSNLSSTWPIIADPNVPASTIGIRVSDEYGPSIRGVLPNGLKVIVDGNIATNLGGGTNEDEVYIIAQDEAHLWEDANAPVLIRAEQPAAASLGVLFVVYGFYAFSFRRYANGHAKVAGTGLATPTF